jgi:hypothetical protein
MRRQQQSSALQRRCTYFTRRSMFVPQHRHRQRLSVIGQNKLVALSINIGAGLEIEHRMMRHLRAWIVRQGLPSDWMPPAALSDRCKMSIVEGLQALGSVRISAEPIGKSIPRSHISRNVVVLKGYDVRKWSEIATKQNHCKLPVCIRRSKF